MDGIDPRLGRLLEAVLAVAEDLDLEAVLERVVIAACGLVDARYGALGVVDEDGEHLTSFVHHGIDPQLAARMGALPTGRGLLGQLLHDPRPLRLEDLTEHPASSGLPPGHPPMRSFLGTPIRVHGIVFGNLYLAEKRGDGRFTTEDEAAVVALAAVAGSAVANARLSVRSRELSLERERARIGRDLHDTVIQNLYATGLRLEAALRVGMEPSEVRDRIEQAVGSIDGTIKEIRTTIFGLHDGLRSGQGSRERLLAVVEESSRLLGFMPRVRIGGPVDTVVDRDLADQLVPVLREALTNVAKHARATSALVRIEVSTSSVELEVLDDGRGFPVDRRPDGMGIANLTSRAQLQGGTFELSSVAGGGARVLWRTPI